MHILTVTHYYVVLAVSYTDDFFHDGVAVMVNPVDRDD